MEKETAIIVIVDDDRLAVKHLKQILEKDGYPVCDFDNAFEALDYLTDNKTLLIISDIRMPQLDGFGFQAAFQSQANSQDTPFIFLSSLGDGQSIIHGLDMGADDYLIKPVEPLLLQAKVRSILRRSARKKAAIFHGDFKKISFIDLLKFCESNGLTGKIEITHDQENHHIPFNAGNIALTEMLEHDDTLSQLYDLEEGTFRIFSHSVNFKEIENAAVVANETPTPSRSILVPAGILSSIQIESRNYQSQTEYIHPQGGSPTLVTLITRGGETLLKRVSKLVPNLDALQLEQTIREQHQRVEQEFLEGQLTKDGIESTEQSPQERSIQLFDDGYEKYRKGDYQGALLAFEEAKKLDPDNRTLEINLQVITKKLSNQKVEGISLGPMQE